MPYCKNCGEMISEDQYIHHDGLCIFCVRKVLVGEENLLPKREKTRDIIEDLENSPEEAEVITRTTGGSSAEVIKRDTGSSSRIMDREISRPVTNFNTMRRGESGLKRLDWAVLKGEGAKYLDFTRAFVNELVAFDMKCEELPSATNEVALKIRVNPFLLGKFQAAGEDGNLYYKAGLYANNKLFFGIMGILAVVGVAIFLIVWNVVPPGPFPGGFNPLKMVGAIPMFLPVWWFLIAGFITMNNRNEKKLLIPIALKSAEAEIRSM